MPPTSPVPLDPLAESLRRTLDLTRIRTFRDLREALQERLTEAQDQLLAFLWEHGEVKADPLPCRPGEILRETASAFLGVGPEATGGLLVLPAPADQLRLDPFLACRVLQALVVRCLEGASWEGSAVVGYERRGGRPVFTVSRRDREEGGHLPVQRALEFRQALRLAEQGLGARVEADLGTGSFALVLPEAALERCQRIEELAPAAEAAEDPTLLERGLVLIVDDSRSVRRLLESVLSAEHRVLVAESGPEAVVMAVDQQPDLVLLDVVMPGMDGYAVCARLKSDPRTEEIPVLFLTSLKGEAEETLALEAGAIDFISKPITPTAVAARVRNHMVLKRSQDRIREISLLDGLTGIANRRRFDRHLREEWSRALRKGAPLSLVLGDVDHFKRYNDHYGHAQGDQCLREVAQCFGRAVHRSGDLAARYGGEEFVCLLPGTDLSGALVVAERIRRLVQALALPHERSDAAETVSVSLGVACFIPDKGQEPTALVEAADRGLYQAKATGRNRACVTGAEAGK